MTFSATYTGLQSIASGEQPGAAGPPESAAHKKLVKAAQEFEGILISQLLGDFKAGLSGDGGGAPLAGSDTLNSLAIQSLSEALARRGGLGIAQMLVHQLAPGLRADQTTTGGSKH